MVFLVFGHYFLKRVSLASVRRVKYKFWNLRHYRLVHESQAKDQKCYQSHQWTAIASEIVDGIGRKVLGSSRESSTLIEVVGNRVSRQSILVAFHSQVCISMSNSQHL